MKVHVCRELVYVCFCLALVIQTHPKVDAHSGDEAAGQESSVFESDQKTGFPHTRISNQHHLHRYSSRSELEACEGYDPPPPPPQKSKCQK